MPNRSNVSAIERGAAKAFPGSALVLGGLLLLTRP